MKRPACAVPTTSRDSGLRGEPEESTHSALYEFTACKSFSLSSYYSCISSLPSRSISVVASLVQFSQRTYLFRNLCRFGGAWTYPSRQSRRVPNSYADINISLGLGFTWAFRVLVIFGLLPWLCIFFDVSKTGEIAKRPLKAKRTTTGL